jgi:hypothetical protein
MLTIIVEGKGEKYSLPVLIEQGQRINLLPDLPDIQYVVANGKSYILQDGGEVLRGMEGFIHRQINITDCREFIVLLDSDRTFPPYLGSDDHNLTREYQEMPLRAQCIGEKYGANVAVC